MTGRVLNAFFDTRSLPPWQRWCWTAAILLAPLLYAAGLALHPEAREGGVMTSPVSRAGALRIARQFGAERGLNTEDWPGTVRVESDADILRYLRDHKGPAAEAVERAAPAEFLSVLLQAPRRGGRLAVRVSLDGRVIGYSLRGRPPREPPPPITSEEAARRALEARFGGDAFLEFGKPEVLTLSREGGHALQEFKWRTGSRALPDLEISEAVEVREGRVVGETASAGLSEAYREAHRPHAALFTALGWFFLVYVLALVVLVLVRYIRRTLQNEISHVRTAVIAVIVAANFMVYIELSDQISITQRGADGPAIAPWILKLIAAVIYLILGGLIGVSYAASEGDLREYYPGKLTSADAILSGRFFNRTSAASILIGLVIGAWLLFAQNSLLRALHLPSLGDTAEVMGLFHYSRAPLLMLLVSTPISAVMESLTLLLPVAMLNRLAKRPGLILWILAPLAFVSSLGFTMNASSKGDVPLSVMVLVCIVKTAGLLVAFFGYDVLACVVTLGFLGFSSYLFALAHWVDSGEIALGLLMAVLAAGAGILIRVALTGREVRDEEVRPHYAGRIAERVFLESEVTAAREAQLRLLPPEPPRLDGLAISASCQAADEVGGDFYDFFRLGPHRLGVLVSDGGGRGLEAALSIALAKGYLMQKAHTGRPPLETLRALRAALGSALETDESSGFCYAVLDLEAGTFEYARYGPSPCVLVESPLEETLVDGSLYVGGAPARDRTRIIIYTDGVGRRLRRPGKSATDRWIQQVAAWHRGASAAELSEAILREVFSNANRGKARLEDDITLVILAMEKAGARSVGHVA